MRAISAKDAQSGIDLTRPTPGYRGTLVANEGAGQSGQTEILRSIVDNIADGVIVVDRQARLVLTNKAAKEMGLPPLKAGRAVGEQARRVHLRDAGGRSLSPDEIPIIRALHGETLVDYEITIERPDGSDAYLSTTSSPLRDDKGVITGAIAIYRDMTLRKRDQKHLASLLRQLETQQRLTLTIVDNVPAFIIFTDASFNTLWINQQACELLGCRREEVMGRNIFAIVPSIEEQAGPIARQVMASGQAQTFSEWPFRAPNGQQTFMDISFVPMADGSETAGLLLMGVDVTEEVEGRQQAEALAQNWKALVDVAHAVLTELTMDRLAQTVVEQVRAVAKADHIALWLAEPERRELNLVAHYNLSPETVKLASHYTYDTPSLVARAVTTGEMQVVEDVLQLDGDLNTSVRAARQEGFRSLLTLPLRARGRTVGALALGRLEPYRFSEQDRETLGTMAGMFASALLNARLYEQTQSLARQAQERASELDAVLQSITDAVLVADASGRVKMTNKVVRDMTSPVADREEIKTIAGFAKVLQCRYADGTPIPLEELAVTRALRGEVVPDIDEIITDPRTGKAGYYLTSAAAIRNEAGAVTGAVCTMRDITRIREMERLRDEFLSTAAHELKTPVTVLKGYAQALLKSPETLPPKFTRALEAIDRQSTKINRLVGDLLDISRLMAGRLELRLESLDLAGLTTEVVDRMDLTTVRHDLNLKLDARPIVRGDRDRLEQVLINYLDNAARYSTDGGGIDIRVYQEGHKAIVSVRDYGIGIPAEKQEHIFERFYRAHAGTPYDYGGMGVSLYISKEIVERHRGQVWLESREGEGSTFYFSLPLKNNHQEGKK